MKVKTRTLTGALLVYTTALAEGYKFGAPERLHGGWGFDVIWPDGEKSAATIYSDRVWYNLPAFAGSGADYIIDRAAISVRAMRHQCRYHATPEQLAASRMWEAYLLCYDSVGGYEDIGVIATGPDRRTAAMRAWCVHKLGEEVEIPDQLLEGV